MEGARRLFRLRAHLQSNAVAERERCALSAFYAVRDRAARCLALTDIGAARIRWYGVRQSGAGAGRGQDAQLPMH